MATDIKTEDKVKDDTTTTIMKEKLYPAIIENQEDKVPAVTGINDLPDEILVHILSYLPLKHLALNISFVCTRWKRLINEFSLWRNSYFAWIESQSLVDAVEFLINAPYLYTLELISFKDCNKILRVATKTCKHVNRLIINRCDPLQNWILGEFMRRCSYLLVTNIWPRIDILDLVRYCGNLKVLKIPFYQDISGKEVRAIADMCKFLQILDLKCSEDMLDEDIVYLIDKRKNILRTLILGGSKLTDVSFTKIGEIQNLSELQLFSCFWMSDKSLSAISKLHLTRLTIQNGHRLTSYGLRNMFGSKSLMKLGCIGLNETKQVNDRVLESIISNCPLLRWIVITGCDRVTTNGLVKLYNAYGYSVVSNVVSQDYYWSKH